MTQAPSPFVMVAREDVRAFCDNVLVGFECELTRQQRDFISDQITRKVSALTVIPVGVDQERACIEGAVTAESAETKSAGGEA